MVSEQNARDLLARAAGTIDVDDAAPMTLTGLPEPPRRRWAVVGAVAAAVLVVAGGGYGASRLVGDEPAPAERPADAAVVEREHVFGQDEVPSLIGYTRDEAVALLEERGVDVGIEPAYSCDQPKGYVLSSSPGPGAPMRSGDRVTLDVTAGPSPAVRCAVMDDRWQQVFDLVRFARGLAGTPAFADEVTLWAGDDSRREVTADAAVDPTAWELCGEEACHSALAAIVEMVTRPEPMSNGDESSFLSTRLVAKDDVGHVGPGSYGQACGLTSDPFGDLGLREHLPTYLWVEYPMDGIFRPCPTVQIEWTKDFRIAAVGLRLPDDDREPEEIDESGLAAQLEHLSTAARFAAWARGDRPAPPPFAQEVRLLIADYPFRRLDGAAAADRQQWATDCPRFMSAPCDATRMNPLAVIDRDGRPVVPTSRPEGRSEFCSLEGGADLPPALEAAVAEDMVEVGPAEPEDCGDAYRVELWIDDEGAIYAVNLAVSPRPGPLR